MFPVYMVFSALYFAFSGLGYFLSVVTRASRAYLFSVTFVIASYIIITLNVADFITALSPIKWATNLYFCLEISQYTPTQEIRSALEVHSYTCKLHEISLAWLALLALGIFFRGLAYLTLVIKVYHKET